MFHRLNRLIPSPVLLAYHRAFSWIAAAWYGHPSTELVVIGVTGTNGKTTTAYLTAKALEASGLKTGCTTTAIFKIGDREWLNDTKMTMLGRFLLQKRLREMVQAGCAYAVIETSSQGVVQYRHRHINYDVAVFTNLTPEHIEAHGGFEAYKQAKVDLFRHVAASPRKVFNGRTIPKVAVLNAQDPHAEAFAVPGFDRVMRYRTDAGPGDVVATDVRADAASVAFTVDGVPMRLAVPGRVNVENALAAVAVCIAFGLPLAAVAERLNQVKGIPGRFERIDEGQPWTVIVDYAPEPASLGKLYDTVDALPKRRLIHVLGSCGGGRDVARRPILGRMAGERADLVIVTNEDPYDDDPQAIMDQVAAGAKEAGKKEGESLLIIPERAEAIREAMRKAGEGDIVLLTGKGCEQAIMIADGGRIPWDEREVARAAIKEELSEVPIHPQANAYVPH
ncbi:MAG: UDP-N-acetylmuramoyl-L-alanyl-D-glutamate--2,6-diaminopimelate ligase [Patescibacteria group bacterium]